MTSVAPCARTLSAARGPLLGTDCMSATTSLSGLPRTPPFLFMSATASFSAVNGGRSNGDMMPLTPIAAPMTIGALLELEAEVEVDDAAGAAVALDDDEDD